MECFIYNAIVNNTPNNGNGNYCDKTVKKTSNPFMHNVVKWPNILLKSCGVNSARALQQPHYRALQQPHNFC